MHLNTQLQPKPKFQKCICRRKISYALGYEVAHQTPPELDINSFVTGVRAGHARSQPAYSEEELKQAYEQFQQEMQQNRPMMRSKQNNQ